MNLFLESDEDSVSVLSSIRVEQYASMKSKVKVDNDCRIITSTIEIDPLNEVWDTVNIECQIPLSEDIDFDTIEDISDYIENLSVYLTTDLNADRLILVDTQYENYDNSNIIDLVMFLYNEVWIQIVRGDLILTDMEWESLLPDTFQLVSDIDLTEEESTKISGLFDTILNDTELSQLLHDEFFSGKQPISITVSQFKDFCDNYIDID